MEQREFLTNEIERTFRKLKDRFSFLEVEVNEMKKAVLTGSYSFSALRIVVLEKDDPLIRNFSLVVDLPGLPNHSFSIYVEPENELGSRWFIK